MWETEAREVCFGSLDSAITEKLFASLGGVKLVSRRHQSAIQVAEWLMPTLFQGFPKLSAVSLNQLLNICASTALPVCSV